MSKGKITNGDDGLKLSIFDALADTYKRRIDKTVDEKEFSRLMDEVIKFSFSLTKIEVKDHHVKQLKATSFSLRGDKGKGPKALAMSRMEFLTGDKRKVIEEIRKARKKSFSVQFGIDEK